MTTIPAPLFALVGATDVVTEKARELPGKLAELEIRRFERPSVDVKSLDPRNADLRSLDPRNADLRVLDLLKIEFRRPSMPPLEMPDVEFAAVAGTALQFAAIAERTYEDLVTRGEQVVSRVRASESEPTPVATPPQATETAAAKPAAKKATKPAVKKASKPAAKKATKPASAAQPAEDITEAE